MPSSISLRGRRLPLPSGLFGRCSTFSWASQLGLCGESNARNQLLLRCLYSLHNSSPMRFGPGYSSIGAWVRLHLATSCFFWSCSPSRSQHFSESRAWPRCFWFHILRGFASHRHSLGQCGKAIQLSSVDQCQRVAYSRSSASNSTSAASPHTPHRAGGYNDVYAVDGGIAGGWRFFGAQFNFSY